MRDIHFLQHRGHRLSYSAKNGRWTYAELPEVDGIINGTNASPEAINQLLAVAKEILAEPRFYCDWQDKLQAAVKAFQKPYED